MSITKCTTLCQTIIPRGNTQYILCDQSGDTFCNINKNICDKKFKVDIYTLTLEQNNNHNSTQTIVWEHWDFHSTQFLRDEEIITFLQKIPLINKPKKRCNDENGDEFCDVHFIPLKRIK